MTTKKKPTQRKGRDRKGGKTKATPVKTKTAASEKTEENKRPQWFRPGQSGNPAGRPKGARAKLGEAFLEAMHADFQANGAAAIVAVRTDKPDAYLKTIAMILPKELKVSVDPLDELDDADLDKYIKQLAAAISLEVRTGESSADQAEASQAKSAKPVRTLQ